MSSRFSLFSGRLFAVRRFEPRIGMLEELGDLGGGAAAERLLGEHVLAGCPAMGPENQQQNRPMPFAGLSPTSGHRLAPA